MQEEKYCLYCTKPFIPKRKEQLYCSRSCSHKSAWQNHPENFANRRKRPNKLLRFVPCNYCGKLLKRYPCQLKKNRLTFCSKQCQGKYISPIYKEKYPQGVRGVGWHHTNKTKKKLRKVMNSPIVNARISQALTGEKNPFYGKHHTEHTKKLIREINKKKLEDPNYRKALLENAYKGWLTLTKQLQKYLKDGLPNPSERKLQEIIEECYPNEYKYNDGWFQLGGKFPDFVNVNGQKKVIELFGEAYHKPEEVDKKQDFYRQFGWHTLIIWAKELSNNQRVKERICSFTERG